MLSWSNWSHINSVSWLAWRIILINFVNIPLWNKGIFLHLHLMCVLPSWGKYRRSHLLIYSNKNDSPFPLLHKCLWVQKSLLLYKNWKNLLNPITRCSHLVLLSEWEPEMSLRLEDSVWGIRYSRKSHCAAVAATMVGGPLLLLKWAVWRDASDTLLQQHIAPTP